MIQLKWGNFPFVFFVFVFVCLGHRRIIYQIYRHFYSRNEWVFEHADCGMQIGPPLFVESFWICFCVIPIIFRNSTVLNDISYLTNDSSASRLASVVQTRRRLRETGRGATKWLCRNRCEHDNLRRKNEDQLMIMCIQFVIQSLYCYALRASRSHWIQMGPIPIHVVVLARFVRIEVDECCVLRRLKWP